MLAANILENTQKAVITQDMRTDVTIVLYLKCKCRASKRSTPIAVVVRKEVKHRHAFRIEKLSVTPDICVSRRIKNKGWAIKPTAKSDTARFANKILAAECKEGVFQIVMSVVEFPHSAVRHRISWTTYIAILRSTSTSTSESERLLRWRKPLPVLFLSRL